MKAATRIFHNPRCSKSRQSMQILEQNDIETDVVEYLKQPPTANELKHILELLALEPRQLMRQHEAPYKELNLADESLDRDTLIQAMIDHPILIERPIVIHGNKAVIGRPPEKILEII